MPEDKLPIAILETVAKAAVAGLVPFGGSAVVLWEGVRDRIASRALVTADEITAAIGIDLLSARLAQSSEFEALVVNALENAARTGYEPKRRLLSRVVINAALDDARVDESYLVEQALRDLDGPQIRALERIRLAEDAAGPVDSPTSDEYEARRTAANEAGAREPESVRAVLVRTGVAAAPMLMGGGVGIAYITEFGRSLLDELRRDASL